MTRRFVLALLVAAGRWVGAAGRQRMTTIFADEPWYRDRREPEREWRGVLTARAVGQGPNARSALAHALRVDERDLPVYTPSRREVLAPFVNRRVIVTGRLVDLTHEGYGEELWPGAIGLDG